MFDASDNKWNAMMLNSKFIRRNCSTVWIEDKKRSSSININGILQDQKPIVKISEGFQINFYSGRIPQNHAWNNHCSTGLIYLTVVYCNGMAYRSR